MRNIITIAKKEWKTYFTSPVGYVFAGLLLVVANWIFFTNFFVLGQADLNPFWSTFGFLLSLFIPAISMGLIAEEKKNSTWEILLSMPINETDLTLGKFLGCKIYLLFTVLLSLPTVITVYILGKPDIGTIVGGYIGLLFLGSAYLSVGIFMSSLSSQAIVGFLGSAVFLLLNSLIGQDVIISRLPGALKNIAGGLSLTFRASKFSTGLIELNDVIFFASWIFIFLTLTVLSLKTRNK